MIENIIDCLLKTCDPNLNNEDRRQNFLIVNNYQNEYFQLDHLKTFLLPCLSQQAKIFGLKCLENFILYKWNTADKNTAKLYLIEIIKEYDTFNVDINSERVIRWIIAKSLMYYIRHECPQNCSTIITDLINLKANGVTTKALILSIFYCLSEILPHDNQMPDKRKKDVIGYLTENFENIITFCLNIIQEATISSSDTIDVQLEAIKTIQSFCGWIKHDNLHSNTDRIFSVLISALKVDSSDYFIFEVIETIFNRKSRSEDCYSTLILLINNFTNWTTLMKNLETGLKFEINPYSDEKFRYLQKLVDLLLVIGNTVINYWERFTKLASTDCFNGFINIIQLATHHPVKILSIEMLSFWYNGFKINDEDLRSTLILNASDLLPLLKYYSIKQNVRNPTNVDHDYLIHLIEQQDEEAYVTRIRFEASKAIATITEYFTQDIVYLSLNMVYSLMKDIKKLEDGSSENQLTSLDSDIMQQLEASRFFTRCVIHNILRPYSKNLQDQVHHIFEDFSHEIIVTAISIINSILTCDNSKVHVVTLYLDLLSLLLPFAANQDDIVKACLEKIFMWFNIVETKDPLCADYGFWRQLHKNCGVWILRIFRDYSFLITPSLFEGILIYYQSICQKLYQHPIILEAMTIYICDSGNFTVEEQRVVISQFINHIKDVLTSFTCHKVFENGCATIEYFHMNKPAPGNNCTMDYPSVEHNEFRTNVIQAVNSVYGICSRIGFTESEPSAVNNKSKKAIIADSPLKDDIIPILPSLLKITRALNQIWSSSALHNEFSSLKEISVFYRDALIKNSTIEKCHPNNAQSLAQLYVNNCRNFISRLHESIWLTLAKCCLNFSGYLYSLRDWQTSVTEYVFCDLDSLPNYKLTPLIKSFVIPFVDCCPIDQCSEVVSTTVIPFINYMFERLHQKWSTVKTDQFGGETDIDFEFEDVTTDGDSELYNEIIEEQVLRILSKAFCDLFKSTMTIGAGSSEDAGRVPKLGVGIEKLFERKSNNDFPTILLILKNLCHAITWKDSGCCGKFSHLIQPLVTEIHSRGLLTIDIIIFIFQQLICSLNIFSGNSWTEIKIVFLGLGVKLYDDYISKDLQFQERFIKFLDKSCDNSIKAFQTKMSSQGNPKVRREHLQTLLKPYIGVPINQLFSQEVFIKDLPPLMKPEWKNKDKFSIDSEDPLCIEDLFKN